jgi:hypothetical protein
MSKAENRGLLSSKLYIAVFILSPIACVVRSCAQLCAVVRSCAQLCAVVRSCAQFTTVELDPLNQHKKLKKENACGLNTKHTKHTKSSAAHSLSSSVWARLSLFTFSGMSLVVD